MKPAILITGAAKRIGKALAISLSKKYTIILHYNNSEDEALETRDYINATGEKCLLLKWDLKDTQGLLRAAILKHPVIVGLINNASLFTKDGEADVNQNQINNLSPISLCHDYFKLLGKGDIINFYDANIQNQKPYLNYSLSKQNLLNESLILAKRFGPKIKINLIAPGPILPSMENPDKFDEIVKATPLQMSPGTNGICDSVIFLLESNFLTGQIIYVDAGQHLG